jgi:hypothetical protein
MLELADDYRRLGCHIVAANGKSELLRPLVIGKQMKIPTYLVFDSDGDKPDKNGSKAKHEKDNKGLLSLVARPEQEPFPEETVWGQGFTMWRSDIGDIVANEIGIEEWQGVRQEADKLYGHEGGLRKNSLHIGASLAFAWDVGKRSESLERLCNQILDSGNCVPLA